MGARPGFVVSKRGQTRRSGQEDVTVEVRVFAPSGASAGQLKALLAEANVESHVEIERIFGMSGGGYLVEESGHA
jgi:hypothetical protein